MSDPTSRTPDVEALTAVLAERAREGAGPDPEPEELLDYLEGRLSPEDEAEMQRRLVASPAATRMLLDLADLVEAGEEATPESGEEGGAGEAPVDLAVHAGWRDFERRLPGREGSAAARPGRTNRGLVALAAVLLVAVLALGTWVWRLKHATDEGLLVANLATVELLEGARSDRVPSVEVEPGEPFRVALYPSETCPSYRAEIVAPDAGAPRRVPGLERDDLGLLTFLFQGEYGRYTLRVFGCEPERQLSTYVFEIQPPGSATSERNAPRS